MPRRLRLSLSVSADGLFEGPGGDLSWHHVDDELHRFFNDALRDSSAFLEGRVTYELMESYWPTADEDPAAEPAVKDFAAVWRAVPKVVYSRTLREVGPGSTLEREVDPDAVRALKDQPGGDLVVGGPDLARTFFAHGLVDEVWLYVNPVVLGRGRPLFDASTAMDLVLRETRTFGNGVVLLRYDVGAPT